MLLFDFEPFLRCSNPQFLKLVQQATQTETFSKPLLSAMSVIRSLLLVLALAAPIASAIECVQCLSFDDSGITDAQKASVELIKLATG